MEHHESMDRDEPPSKRPKQETYVSDDRVNDMPAISASLLLNFLADSLAKEAETRQRPSSLWSKQQALDICLEAVDALKSQIKSEGYICLLPSWIKCSEFVRQYEKDFPEEEVLKLDNSTRLFELPSVLSEDSVVKVMDNIRYFGISDDSSAIKKSFEFYIDRSNQHLVQSQKESFPELKVLWENVEFTITETRGGNHETFTANAASRNLLVALQYAHENGFPWNERTCYVAVVEGHLDCLKYAHENGCRWDEKTCNCAAAGGHLDCLKYAHENGCPLHEATCFNAAISGDLDCLKYAHENGCPWDKETCATAAGGGHLDCLKYAHENGCPWDEATCATTAAAAGGHLDCLKYAHENGCPLDEATCYIAAEGGHLDCLKYAHENGCPWTS